ncbi:MAG: pyridoxamine 5'-phosphate oxidase family protein [Methanosarcinaceae archaeon]|nr:pyridoxamine 5'-phosphate oxidase family protein [Methanosarcinaceae archaeon]
MEKVYKFIKEAKFYFLATVDGDQPKVRPFGTIHIFENKLYIQTGKIKDVSKQINSNPKVEICAINETGDKWIRVTGTLVDDDRVEAKKSMLDAFPSLKEMYSEDDENTQVLYFKDAVASFCCFTAEPEVLNF